ncbi:LPS export ABC transporter permease LptG [Legionella taurinensis]|uniref:LPS export ABC transporter permease LptG n=1 Tax=Legionella taurinensis TaxID=70611 RepID=A0AB38N6E3_9GAMM|nr:LPS export ABC transporter permease LptG [Legionella taurinensis]MDX1837438.1 LPS export ABC transporter permease LptG [Legionella taurinensis]PUT40784.1 LPS export ABC transporter permease LptG [Legionella taurinensis]PUT44206.1 LPS export ABC transporter permease LptG [Legionella taurinensis]PUT47507.1 LPS export ABC transporter permease LptG [Legionella taurinensis]PUT48646.1 LPS export ABC transporter permease LptG [Legionella taurinensis]
MILIERYIARTVLASIGLVTLMLAGLQVFILFVNQLDDLGRADFGLVNAAIFVFLQMPYQVYLFFPMASLMGCLIGLGMMANHRELIVMRAAGMSIGQITLAVLKVAFVIIVLVTLIGETVVPKLAYFANDLRTQALSGGQALRTAQGVWLRNQNDFITIGSIEKNTLHSVFQFRFDEQHHLRFARRMERIEYQDGQWKAYGIAQTDIFRTKTVASTAKAMVWDVSVKPKLLNLTSSEPDEMTLHELRQYLREQKQSHQTASNYQLAYWQRLIQPLTTVVMMVLAIPFIFGPLRSSTMGSKLLLGITVGFGFHILNRFFGPVSQVFQWPPVLAAIGPTILFALLGLFMMAKAK